MVQMKGGMTCGKKVLAAGLVLMAVGTVSFTAQAGQRCDAGKPTATSVARSMQLAHRTADALEAAHAQNGTRVVLLARAGQDLSKYGQHWSHVGWAYRTPQGAWRVLHKLNTCGTDQSFIARQGLGEFFLDDLWRYEAGWLAPSPDVQAGLWALLQDNRRAVRMHEPRYSMVSYAWGTRYQQSNQWALETMALAADPKLAQREQAQAWLKLKNYEPARLRVGALTRLGGRMTTGNVAFDDHPSEQRFADRIDTITADSMLRWLARQPASGSVRLVGG